jgi:hypothetical protein
MRRSGVTPAGMSGRTIAQKYKRIYERLILT